MHEFKRRFPPPPPDWSRPRLADIAERVTTRNIERHPNVLTISAEFGLISQSEFFSRRVASESVTGYFLLKHGDFAYNKSYSRGYPLGAIRRLDRYKKGCVSPLYICFRPCPDAVNSDFLLHYLDGGAIDVGLANIAKEGVRNHGLLNVGVADFFSLEVPLPPVAEQRVVAEIVDTLDTTIRQTEAIIEKLKQVKQGLLHDLLTRGIDANGELRPPQSQAPHLYKDSPLGWIPSAWACEPLEKLTLKIVDGVHQTPTYVPMGVPFVTIKNLTDSQDITFTSLNYISQRDHRLFCKRADPRPGDVLVTKDGTLGVARLVRESHPEFSIFVSVAQIRPVTIRLSPQLLLAFFDSEHYRAQMGGLSGGSGLKHIHLEQFRRFNIPLPSLSEQSAICSGITSISERLRLEHRTLGELGKLKSGLMDDLLTGRVRVTPLLDVATSV